MDLSFVKAICIGGEAVSQDYRDKMSAFIRERGSDGITSKWVRRELKMKHVPWQTVREDLYKNHNHSWYKEIYERNKKGLNRTAMVYRGNRNISYGELFSLSEKYGKALKYYGVNPKDEFIACLRLTPDYPILVAAASLINAKVNLIAPFFCDEFLCDIVIKSHAKVVLVNDWDFATIAPALLKCCANKTIVIMPVDAWDAGNNPHSELMERFYSFDRNSFEAAYRLCKTKCNICMIDEFLKCGEGYLGQLDGNGKLSDEIAITYTSGSTRKGWHKGVAQRNETYIIMGRYHDPEVCGMPKMNNCITLSEIGTQADTTLMSCISDPLMQGGIVALDPIIDEHYFLHSLAINKAGLAVATRTFWLRAMKETYENAENHRLTLPYLYVPTEGGEPLSAGEEYALNKWLKDVKAGTKITHTPFSIVKMSEGGGDSEHGSLFLRLFRGYYAPLQRIRRIREPMGMFCYKFAKTVVLRPDGSYCKPMELGRLAANSPTAMKKYYNDDAATAEYFIKDAYGNIWGDMKAYGYRDKWGNFYIKGRISENDPKIKAFQVSGVISEDYTNIMSCEVVTEDSGREVPYYIAHIEMQTQEGIDVAKVLRDAYVRCRKEFGDAICSNLYYRIHSSEEGFASLSTTKRNVLALKEEGLRRATKFEVQ